MAAVAPPQTPVDAVAPPQTPVDAVALTPVEVQEPAHKECNSKEQFMEALQTKDKYVLLYAYTGEVTQAAEAAARRHVNNTVAYKVDIDKFPTCKENLKLETFPAVVVFKDGKEIKRVQGVNKDNAKEIIEVLV